MVTSRCRTQPRTHISSLIAGHYSDRLLAEQYRKKTEDIENAGYQRFAVTLRGLSEFYARDAERIISEHKRDNEEDE